MYDQIAQNKRRSWVLAGGYTLFVLIVAVLVTSLFDFGAIGIVFAVVVAGGSTFLSYWKSDTIALRMSRARPAPHAEFTRYHNLVEGLCIGSGLPKPDLYVIDDAAPNAFATGRNPENAAIAVTTGLLDKLNRVELEGVLAHELSHIKNYDMLIGTLAVTMVGVVALIADLTFRFMWLSGHRRRDDSGQGPQAVVALVGIVLLVAAPLIAQVMRFAMSRRREVLADFTGVGMTRYPPGLVSALEKLRDDRTIVRSGSRATAHLWIEEPMAQSAAEGNLPRINRLFATHPPLDDRIAALREL